MSKGGKGKPEGGSTGEPDIGFRRLSRKLSSSAQLLASEPDEATSTVSSSDDSSTEQSDDSSVEPLATLRRVANPPQPAATLTNPSDPLIHLSNPAPAATLMHVSNPPAPTLSATGSGSTVSSVGPPGSPMPSPAVPPGSPPPSPPAVAPAPIAAPGSPTPSLAAPGSPTPSLVATPIPTDPLAAAGSGPVYVPAYITGPFDAKLLSQKNYQKYQQCIPDAVSDPYKALAEILEQQTDPRISNINDRLDQLNLAMIFVVRGAKQALAEAEEESKKDPLKVVELKQRLLNFLKIRDMLYGMRTITAANNRYTEDYYNAKLAEALRDIPAAQRAALESAISYSTKYHTENKRRNEYDENTSEFRLRGKKYDLVIQKEEVGGKVELKAHFKYNRAQFLRSGSGGKFKNTDSQRIERNYQMAALITTAIHQYDIGGSPQNPIVIGWTGKNNMSDVGLQALMEYKKRAIIENRTFDAKDANGKAIKIGPTPNLTPEEKKYFLEYAMQTPGYGGKDAKHCAGYQYLKHEGFEKKLKDDARDDETAIGNGLNEYLQNWKQGYDANAVKKMAETAKSVKVPEAANAGALAVGSTKPTI
ncbi:MAG: hypothetical protein ACHQJ6_07565 [Candidatus Berkiellales bacterium]